MLGDDVGQYCREFLRENAQSIELVIYAGSINLDHVQMQIGLLPNVLVSRTVQYMKGKNSHKLLSEYARHRKRYGGQHLWAQGYWVATSGDVTDEVWKRYSEEQKTPTPNDEFKYERDASIKQIAVTSYQQ